MDNSKQQPTTIPQTEQEWRTRLTPEQYEVLRNKGTERPFTGAYASTKEPGVYRCAGCGAALFSSTTKYESGTGWPSFWEPIEPGSRRAARRPDPLDASHGGHLCAMRRPPGACVLRRTAADGGSLLHELGLAGARAGVARGVDDRPGPRFQQVKRSRDRPSQISTIAEGRTTGTAARRCTRGRTSRTPNIDRGSPHTRNPSG